MNLLVLNENFESVALIDTYESLIWTDRYREAGDFELYVAADEQNLTWLRQNYYLYLDESEHLMIIESNEVIANAEEGSKLIVTGRSLESILERRIVWTQTNVEGNFQNAVLKLIDDAIINPKNASRKIPNFIAKTSIDERITKLEIDAQYTGDNIYDIVTSLCEENKIGFKILLDDSDRFVFELYIGVDRSYDQTDNPFVVFSPKFENIINSNYLESYKPYKNVTLVAGEGEGTARKTMEVGDGSVGLIRREMFTDARDISSKDGDKTLSAAKYNAKLKARGQKDLAENKKIKTFEGKVEATQMFVYNKDFRLGDIVQITNEYGIEGKARVTEMVYSHSDTGLEIYPNFEAIQEDE